MLENFNTLDIKNNKHIFKNFLNADYKDLKINCNIYKGNFYLDTFNYFLINEEYKVFNDLFTRDIYQNNKHFFTKSFYNNFTENIENLKEFKNIFILGSNAANNYYSNLVQFLPRIFFTKKNNIKIAIHRNSSTKFRDFITLILNSMNIEHSFVYLDDGFYKFINCEIPQFLNIADSIKVLKNFLFSVNSSSEDKKIYVTREDSAYRKIVNESDLLEILRSKGYKVINPQLYKIDEQINLFRNADKIIGAHGSNLSNIVFCKEGTEIFEIGPNFKNEYEKVFENRYRFIAEINNLKYHRYIADTVSVKSHSLLAQKYINKKILDNSEYYKNLIIKISEIKDIL